MGEHIEIWKDVVGFEGRYLVSDLGKVKSIITKDSRGQKRTPKILQHLSKFQYVRP